MDSSSAGNRGAVPVKGSAKVADLKETGQLP
jgi:hypothetical protein